MYVKKCLKRLKFINNIKNKKLQRAILNEMMRQDDCLYRAIKEVAVNTVNKKIKLNQNQKTRLRRHRKLIKELVLPSKSKKKRTNLVVQSGGFLSIVLPSAIALISEIIRNVKTA